LDKYSFYTFACFCLSSVYIVSKLFYVQQLLGIFDLIDFEQNEEFVLSTQDFVVGGFGKWPQLHPGQWKTVFNYDFGIIFNLRV